MKDLTSKIDFGNKKKLHSYWHSSKELSEYCVDKAIEECLELALILQQKRLKPSKVSKSEITHEIADVQIRLDFLKSYFGPKTIKRKAILKRKKLIKYLEEKEYRRI